MTKSEQMDELIAACGTGIKSAEIVEAVEKAYGIVFGKIANVHETLNAHLAGNPEGNSVSGPELRRLINEKFGVNLDALSALDGARFSLFSKGQWTLRNERDLLAVRTGDGDVDVEITPTSYYLDITGQRGIPDELASELQMLGYECDPDGRLCRYVDPAGRAVTDAFKGQTIRALTGFIRERCAGL